MQPNTGITIGRLKIYHFKMTNADPEDVWYAKDTKCFTTCYAIGPNLYIMTLRPVVRTIIHCIRRLYMYMIICKFGQHLK